MLADLNTRPRTTYMAEVINPNQELDMRAPVEHATDTGLSHDGNERPETERSTEYNDPMLDPITGEYRVIAPGQTFKSVTEKISRIVLTAAHAAGLVLRLLGGRRRRDRCCWSAVTWLFLKGVGIWAITHPGGLGLRHHQLRLVDRYRPRRHADLGHSAAVQADLAQLDQPLRRGDDDLRRGLRRHVPADPRGPSVAGILAASRYPNTMNVWPQFRSPLVWDVFAVSTYATISVVFWYIGMIPDFGTLRDRAKSQVRAVLLRHAVAGLARFDAALDAL